MKTLPQQHPGSSKRLLSSYTMCLIPCRCCPTLSRSMLTLPMPFYPTEWSICDDMLWMQGISASPAWIADTYTPTLLLLLPTPFPPPTALCHGPLPANRSGSPMHMPSMPSQAILRSMGWTWSISKPTASMWQSTISITAAPPCACLSPTSLPANVADLPSSRLTASSRWTALTLPLPI